ncbi:hypothetical protein OG864_24315 [Streptomyces sp. NBC_00124]|uniref:hypothetical protein n=1 Tax=Streptomyces sp. NBC_00124 TaxID=2975662 RepID=UPI00224CDEB6|nr:hypothetical protein [Streptomyces sp. NBC_00124]MCX5361838.1 hypothetical protein [Streptomyces sp. NBC_00124]
MGKGSKKRRRPRKKTPHQGVVPGPARPARPRSPRTGTLSAGFFVLVLGLLPFLGGGYMLAGALGLVGQRAVFTATSCAVVRTGKSPYVACGGNLVVARRPLRYASVDTRLPLGRPAAVRVLPVGPLETVGPAAVSGWSTVTLGGLTVLTGGALAVFRERLRSPVRDTVFRVVGVPGGLTLGGLLVYVVVRVAA